MINAKQARENSYDKTISWCEKNLQPEIESARAKNEKRASRLFWDHEVNPEKLKKTLEQQGFRVKLTNMTELSGLSKEHGMVYNVTVYW